MYRYEGTITSDIGSHLSQKKRTHKSLSRLATECDTNIRMTAQNVNKRLQIHKDCSNAVPNDCMDACEVITTYVTHTQYECESWKNKRDSDVREVRIKSLMGTIDHTG